MKKSLKKGGLASIITVVIMLGIVLALIAVLLNGGLIEHAATRANNSRTNIQTINSRI